MGEKFPNLMKAINPQIQENEWVPSRKKHEGNSTKVCHIQITQIPVIKRKSLKQSKKKDITCKGTKVRVTAEVSSIMQVRWQWNNILKILAVGDHCQPIVLYPETYSKKLRQNNFFRHTKAERINCEHICTKINVTKKSLNKRKIILDGNLDVHKGIKNTVDL